MKIVSKAKIKLSAKRLSYLNYIERLAYTERFFINETQTATENMITVFPVLLKSYPVCTMAIFAMFVISYKGKITRCLALYHFTTFKILI